MGEHTDVERPPVYEDNGIVFYRASSLGGCPRMLALARQGYDPLPPPENMQKVFNAGHDAEHEVFAKGLIMGSQQTYVELGITGNIKVCGHLDAWTELGTFEVKSQSKNEWGLIRNSPLWYRYSYQISVYMHATGLPLTVVRVLRQKDGSIDDTEREVFVEPPVSLAGIRKRVFDVELLARKDLGEVECDPIEYPCPFFYTHSNDPLREKVSDKDAEVLAHQYDECKTLAKVANDRLKKSRDALLEWMGERKRVELEGGWLVTKYKVGGHQVNYESKPYESVRVTRKDEDGRGRVHEAGGASSDTGTGDGRREPGGVTTD